MYRIAKFVGRAVLVLLLLCCTGWAVGALHLGPPHATGAAIAIGLVGLVAIGTSLRPRLHGGPLVVFALAWLTVLGFWQTVRPSNDRNWQPSVGRTAHATIDGDLVTLYNIRNFDYRSETDFTVRYYDKTYDLRELDEADLIAVYWMGDAIAHIMVSFGFSGKDYLTVSIETRMEQGESYDTLAGFFRNYEIAYIVGDERDLIRLRTNYRKDPPEEAYLFRTNAPPENVRRLFLSYLAEINTLHEQPDFYNTLTTNCTTNVLRHTRVNPGDHRYSWKILLSGYAPLYTYERGGLGNDRPFEEIKRAAHINPKAQAADTAADFSQRIRAGMPKPPPRS